MPYSIFIIITEHYDKALAQFQDALTHYRAIFGKDHASTTKALVKIGVCLIRNRQHDEAMELLDEAYILLRTCGYNNSLHIAEIQFNKGIILCETGQLKGAIDAYEKSIDIRREKLGDDSIEVAQVSIILQSMSKLSLSLSLV